MRQAGVWSLERTSTFQDGVMYNVCIIATQRAASAFLPRSLLFPGIIINPACGKANVPVLHCRRSLGINDLRMFICRVWMRSIFPHFSLFLFANGKE